VDWRGAEFVRRLSDKPVKVSLPGPYLLTRTMWMECISDRAYADREELARDIVRVLREEAHHLLAAGVALLVRAARRAGTAVRSGGPGASSGSFWGSGDSDSRDSGSGNSGSGDSGGGGGDGGGGGGGGGD